MHKGRKIATPGGFATRPTAQRVREALFSILQSTIPGARVLDLFSGSGAFAIEALSRGSASAYLVDSNRVAFNTIVQNINLLNLQQCAHPLLTDAAVAIERFKRENVVFDIVFLDPPYGAPILEEIVQKGVLLDILSSNGKIIIETDLKYALYLDARYVLENKKQYGDTALWFVTKPAAAANV